MDFLFLSRVVLSFLVAGSWIALVTLLAERLGSRLGGLFANLPSNILISLISFVVSFLWILMLRPLTGYLAKTNNQQKPDHGLYRKT